MYVSIPLAYLVLFAVTLWPSYLIAQCMPSAKSDKVALVTITTIIATTLPVMLMIVLWLVGCVLVSVIRDLAKTVLLRSKRTNDTLLT